MNDEMFPMTEVIKFFCDEHTPETEIDRLLSNLREEDIKGHEKKQELIGKVLLVASDAQTVTGMSPSHKYTLVFTFHQRNCLDYHRNGPAAGFEPLPLAHHIRYYQLYIVRGRATFLLDIRFNRWKNPRVSNFAAICCSYDYRVEKSGVRYISIGVFGLLYTGFTIMFGIRLNNWNDQIPGRCYSTSGIASPNAKHPLVDQIYLGLTSLYVLGIAQAAMVYCQVPIMRLSW